MSTLLPLGDLREAARPTRSTQRDTRPRSSSRSSLAVWQVRPPTDTKCSVDDYDGVEESEVQEDGETG